MTRERIAKPIVHNVDQSTMRKSVLVMGSGVVSLISLWIYSQNLPSSYFFGAVVGAVVKLQPVDGIQKGNGTRHNNIGIRT